jgi:aminoglycoside phosphotransferase (APT) family kinase protein
MTAGRPEVAAVRPGEDLDWDRIGRYLRTHLPELSGELEVLQFPNGSANLTYLLRVGDQELVLRRPPFGQLAPGAHDMRREYRTLSRLHAAYGRAPRALLLIEDHDVAGADALVVEYRRGVVVWVEVPESLALPDAGRRIGHAVVDALADLHAVDPDACGLSDLGRPEGYLERQVTGWRKRWDLVAPDDRNGPVDRLGEALAATLPRSGAAAVLHNDFKLDNCQFTPGDPDRVTSVFDWDMATLGDPLVDLGTLLNYWPDPADPPGVATAVPGLDRLGLPDRASVVDRYATASGSDLDGIGWYVAFGCWRTAVVLRQLYARHLRGETTDPRMAERSQQVDPLAERGLDILGGRVGV